MDPIRTVNKGDPYIDIRRRFGVGDHPRSVNEKTNTVRVL